MALVKQVQVTFDCASPRAVAAFWRAAVGYVDPPPPEGFDSWDAFEATLPSEFHDSRWALIDPSGSGPRFFFQRVPEVKSVKNRLHLDIRVAPGLTGDARFAALDAEAARLEALGATRVEARRASGFEESWIVMQDVEGNEFCLD